MPPVKPTPEMEIADLRAELVGLHRHLRALASRWDERSRVEGEEGEEALRCAQELRDQLNCTPTYWTGDGGEIIRSRYGAVVVNQAEVPRG